MIRDDICQFIFYGCNVLVINMIHNIYIFLLCRLYYETF